MRGAPPGAGRRRAGGLGSPPDGAGPRRPEERGPGMAESLTEWGDAAAAYDLSYAGMCGGAIPAVLAHARGGVLADVGCGTGRLARAAAAAGHRVLACDPSPSMAAAARRRLAGCPAQVHRAGLPGLAGFTDRGAPVAADTVVCAFVLQHLPDPAAAMAALAALARPGAAVITVTWPTGHLPHRHVVLDLLDELGADPLPAAAASPLRPSPEGLAELAAGAGLEVVRAGEERWTWSTDWPSFRTGLRAGIAHTGARFLAQGPGLRAEVERRLPAALAPYGPPEALRIPCRAALCVARRPG